MLTKVHLVKAMVFPVVVYEFKNCIIAWERETEDEMVGWHHQLNRHKFGQTLGGGEGQGRLHWRAAIHGVAKSQTQLSD